MSMNNYILNLLNIEDKNIFISPNVEERVIKKNIRLLKDFYLTFLIFVLVVIVLTNLTMTFGGQKKL